MICSIRLQSYVKICICANLFVIYGFQRAKLRQFEINLASIDVHPYHLYHDGVAENEVFRMFDEFDAYQSFAVAIVELHEEAEIHDGDDMSG